MKKFTPPSKIISFKLISAMALLFLIIGSCKKDIITNKEKINPARLKEIHSYQNGNELSTINFAQFKTKANLQSLGNLKDIFLSPTASQGELMSIHTTETYNGFTVETDSIRVLKTNGHTSYIFPVKLSNPRAITFQNLTIDESTNGSLVFVNTYTPTKKWLADWKVGKAGKFDGDISVSYLDNGQRTKLNNNNANSYGKIASTTTRGKVALVYENGCSTTTYTFELPYNCGSGQHGPGDSGCYLTGEDRAGIAIISFDVTTCSGESGSGGGGGTSPTPPGGYNPCGSGRPIPNVSYNGAKGAKLMVHESPDCDPTMPPLIIDPVEPPADIKKDSLKKYYPCMDKLILQKLENDNLYSKLIQPFQSVYVPGIGTVNFNGVPKLTYNFSSQTWGAENKYQLGETAYSNNSWNSTIFFNSSALTNASQLFLQVATIHETGHAYIHYYIKNGQYNVMPPIGEGLTWPMGIVNFGSLLDGEMQTGNFVDHSILLNNYFEKMVQILKSVNGTNYTDTEYRMAALYGMDNAGTRPTEPLLSNFNGVDLFSVYKNTLEKTYNSILNKYNITPAELNTFNNSNITNTPASKKLPSNCP